MHYLNGQVAFSTNTEAREHGAWLAEREAAGLCTYRPHVDVDGVPVMGPVCDGDGRGRSLGRCREHGGINQLAAKAHRSVQHHGWRNYWS